jgi:6-phosphogluconolactonase
MLSMSIFSRRSFLFSASAAALAVSAQSSFAARHARALAAPAPGNPKRKRVYVGSYTPNGLLAYHWDPVAASLTPAGVAAHIPNVTWIAATASGEYLYTASELSEFNGKPTGEVASFRQLHGELTPVSTANSAGTGTCQVALDRTGRVLIAADYAGGSAASFLIKNGALGEAVWTEHYTEHGPNKDRQEASHAHFASFSPDNRFAYINDLGGDSIHIYKLNPATAQLTPAGLYRGAAGVGPRTLHFHPNDRTAYCVNELVPSVDVLDWNRADGSFSLRTQIPLLPEGNTTPATGCDVALTRDGRFAYFAVRGQDFLYSFKVDPRSGDLAPLRRSPCGGKTPRHITLDPTERWMLVANQGSSLISVFARNPETGALADEAKNFDVPTPMRILFT